MHLYAPNHPPNLRRQPETSLIRAKNLFFLRLRLPKDCFSRLRSVLSPTSADGAPLLRFSGATYVRLLYLFVLRSAYLPLTRLLSCLCVPRADPSFVPLVFFVCAVVWGRRGLQVKTQAYSRLSQRMNSDILYDAGTIAPEYFKILRQLPRRK